MKATRNHPARYTPSILDVFAELAVAELPSGSIVLDPCAGTGERLTDLATWYGWYLILVDIEQWPRAVPGIILADSTDLHMIADGSVDAVMTSVTYGNGLSDKGLNMKDPKGRLTYDLGLGRPLHPNNTGAYGVRQGEQAYRRYLELHRAIFAQCFCKLRPGGSFLLNCSDCYQNGQLRTVTADNLEVAASVGFVLEQQITVVTPRHRGVGANAHVRTEGEYVALLRKPS